jgi:osmoprotectant transport system substrate-binding protein
MKKQLLTAVSLGMGLALTLTACGGSSSSSGSGASAGTLAGASITVGSKDFDEQLVLGNITKLALQNAGADVTDQINLGGTNVARKALTSCG